MMKDYHGSCHCGAVDFNVSLNIETVITCNCSHCHKKGMQLAFTSPEHFTLNSCADMLTEYRFNTKKIAHLFCRVCGVQSFGRGVNNDGGETISINLRTLDGFDVEGVPTHMYNGRDY